MYTSEFVPVPFFRGRGFMLINLHILFGGGHLLQINVLCLILIFSDNYSRYIVDNMAGDACRSE
jgi:hypothetical protein